MDYHYQRPLNFRNFSVMSLPRRRDTSEHQFRLDLYHLEMMDRHLFLQGQKNNGISHLIDRRLLPSERNSKDASVKPKTLSKRRLYYPPVRKTILVFQYN